MRTLVIAAIAACSLATAPAALATSSPVAPATLSAACVNAKIEGQSKCIQRGQFCKRSARAMRDYRRYGLSCTKRDRNGRYHLE
jgi:hypothetical protein